MNTMLASLSLNDTPVGYKPPVGPWVKFTATYNQNNADQPATFSYVNLGPDWTCNWISYITDDPASPGVNVTCYAPGGGTLTFSGYNSSNQTFAPELMTQAILRMTSSSSYELQFRTGAKKEFALSNGATGSTRQIFLTQVIDPAGNSVQLNYDSSLRITSIVDAIGQPTTLTYGDAAFPYAITKVTDPFGRAATFQYNSSGLLTQITDVLGLTSQYTYSTNDFISKLVTPYGTTTFTSGTSNGVTWLQATDPLGESELDEAIPNNAPIPGSDPASTLPVGMSEFNAALNYRDTFYWDKQAFQAAAGDYAIATVYHFLHNPDVTTESGILESLQRPLENKVWCYYPGQSTTYALGSESINQPSAVGRVLDDGTTQLRLYQYNALGWVTNATDPIGRNFTYVYSTNNMDLLAIRMTSNGKNDLLRSTTYNSQHKPLTITDASGQTTSNTYNARGQILSTTDPLADTTTFSYDANGYLLSITGPLQSTNDVTSFTHDGFGRIQTITDTEGYTLIYAYDAADRVTSITHPDGTAEQFVYGNLDLVASADRLGRWTTNSYNADRQLISRQDPLGRITQYQYCDCGGLEAIFDPLGNETSWDHDVQSRITAKHYADGSTISYAYENTTSRLHSRLDEKGQQTFYQYYEDNKLKSLSYSNAIVATPTVTFAYDTNYNRIVQMQDGIGTTTYAYNPVTATPALGAGRLSALNGPLPNSLVTYQYDQMERVTNRAIDGVAETITFDVLGRSTVVTNALGGFQYSYVDATRLLASSTYPNALTNSYMYYGNTGDERLMQIGSIASSGATLPTFNYTYNSVGQITSRSIVTGDSLTTENYGYDAADQLTSVVCHN
jgi:YD repeat-containing protein